MGMAQRRLGGPGPDTDHGQARSRSLIKARWSIENDKVVLAFNRGTVDTAISWFEGDVFLPGRIKAGKNEGPLLHYSTAFQGCVCMVTIDLDMRSPNIELAYCFQTWLLVGDTFTCSVEVTGAADIITDCQAVGERRSVLLCSGCGGHRVVQFCPQLAMLMRAYWGHEGVTGATRGLLGQRGGYWGHEGIIGALRLLKTPCTKMPGSSVPLCSLFPEADPLENYSPC